MAYKKRKIKRSIKQKHNDQCVVININPFECKSETNNSLKVVINIGCFKNEKLSDVPSMSLVHSFDCHSLNSSAYHSLSVLSESDSLSKSIHPISIDPSSSTINHSSGYSELCSLRNIDNNHTVSYTHLTLPTKSTV